MKYFTSDLHFGHENVLRLCNRPFSCVEEMDEHLIQEWNKLVHRNDEVYILGDFSFRAEKPPEYYLDRLKGEKHLIIGNHDKSWMKKVDLDKYFKSVQWMTLVNTGKGNATLCHFPVLDGEGKF
nr:metallophosphoesterase [Clostridia bacterium]